MDTNEAAKHAHKMVQTLRAFQHVSEVLEAASTVEGRLAGLEAKITEERGELDSVKAKVATARRTLKSLETSNEATKSAFDATARRRAADLQAKLNQMNQEAQNGIDALKAAGDAELEKVTAQVRQKKRDLKSLQSEVQAAQRSLGTLRDHLSGVKLAAAG